ncbi:hypothetical protein P8452_74117 [Trifolium repens]|nr:hypothetical protein P8452_74117 [Trifolium repens]
MYKDGKQSFEMLVGDSKKEVDIKKTTHIKDDRRRHRRCSGDGFRRAFRRVYLWWLRSNRDVGGFEILKSLMYI